MNPREEHALELLAEHWRETREAHLKFVAEPATRSRSHTTRRQDRPRVQPNRGTKAMQLAASGTALALWYSYWELLGALRMLHAGQADALIRMLEDAPTGVVPPLVLEAQKRQEA